MTFKETPLGKMPDTWGIAKISEVTSVVTDYVANGSFASLAQNVTYKDEEDVAVLIRLVDYNNNFRGDFVFIDEHAYEFLSKSKLYGGEIIISNVGANVGTVFRCPRLKYKMSLAPNAIMVQFNGNDSFYYHWLKGHYGQKMLKSIVTGSAQPKFNKTNFRDMLVPVPPIETQDRIAAVLDLIEHKIEQNNAINENLEQQIEAILLNLIQSDSLKDSIETVKLGDYLYIKGRIGWKGLKKDEYLDQSDYRIINGESLTKNGIDWKKAGYISAERYEESPEIMLQVGDILLSKDGTIGKIGFVDKLDFPSTVASGIFVIRNIKPEIISTQFIYYLLKSKLFTSFIASRTEGSVIPHLYQKDFMEFTFPLPNAEEMQRFDSLTAPLFSTIITNLRENELLSATRDSLLPKLMNGEIDVSEVKI